MHRSVVVAFSFLIVSLVFIGCREPGITTYERIVIDTYSPNNGITADTYVDLFDSNGDPDTDDPWSGDDTADAIAWDDDGNLDWATMSRIDYTGALTSGTYYIRVRGKTTTENSWYAIRALALKLGDGLPAYIYPGLDASPDSYEDDDDPLSSWIPLYYVPLQLGNANNLSRSIDYELSVSDVDWFELVLP